MTHPFFTGAAQLNTSLASQLVLSCQDTDALSASLTTIAGHLSETLPAASPSQRVLTQLLLVDFQQFQEADLFSVDEAKQALARGISSTSNRLWSLGFPIRSEVAHARLLQLSDSYDQLQSARSTPALAAAWPPEVRADMEALTHGLLHFLNRHEQHTEQALDHHIADIAKRLEQNGLQSVIAPPAIRPRELSVPAKPVIHPIYFQGDPNPSPEVLHMMGQISEEARLAVAAFPLAKVFAPDTLVAEMMISIEGFKERNETVDGKFAIWNDRGVMRATFFDRVFSNFAEFQALFNKTHPEGELHLGIGFSRIASLPEHHSFTSHFSGSYLDGLFLSLCGKLLNGYQRGVQLSSFDRDIFFELYKRITEGNPLDTSVTVLDSVKTLFDSLSNIPKAAAAVVQQRTNLKTIRGSVDSHLRGIVRIENAPFETRETVRYLMGFPFLFNQSAPGAQLAQLRNLAGVSPLPAQFIGDQQYGSIRAILERTITPSPATTLSAALKGAHLLTDGETTYLLLDENEIAALKRLGSDKKKRILEDIHRSPVVVQGNTVLKGLTPLKDSQETTHDTWYHTLTERLEALLDLDPLIASELERLFAMRTRPELAPFWIRTVGLVMHHDSLKETAKSLYFFFYDLFLYKKYGGQK